MVQLAKVLNRVMKEYGATPRSLSKDTKIPITTLRNWQAGILPSAKNLHYISVLAEYFDLSVNELLFNKKDLEKEIVVLFSTTFVDSGRRYKLTIEKIEKQSEKL